MTKKCFGEHYEEARRQGESIITLGLINIQTKVRYSK